MGTEAADSCWRPPPRTLELRCDEVHVWRCALDLEPSRVEELLRSLSSDERARAEQLRFPMHRARFIAARGLLRTILGRGVGMEPAELRFCRGQEGKPYLAQESGGDVLRFNMSHSHGWALYAVTCGREVGIDLEHVRPDVACERIAERFFSRREAAALNALPVHARAEAFFRCWTHKEACIKAKGGGFWLRLSQFEVTLDPEGAGVLLSTPCDPQEASRWSLQDLEPGPGFVAALVVEGAGWQLKCWHWPERQAVHDDAVPSSGTTS